MKILIAGDLVPTYKNINKFEKDNFIEDFEGNFQEIWNKADFRIFNLECPLGENKDYIDKNGAILQANPNAIKGIKSLNPNLILLSNNHILDHNQQGLSSTLKLLQDNEIPYTGILENSEEVYQPYYIKKDNLKIGIYNLCENEFSIATRESRGANPLNEAKNYLEIKKAKDNCDYLIVIFHGGKEFYRYPSPNLQKICRNFIDFGANFVITQHSHCIGTEEEYNEGRILYGQGNFIFDNGVDDEYWNTALLIELDLTKTTVEINYIPIEKKNGLIRLSTDTKILKDFYDRKEKIKSKEFINEQYKNFANKQLNAYLAIINKPTLLKRIMNRLSKGQYYLSVYNKKELLKILNILECEAHRELFIKGIKERIKNAYTNE